MDEGISKFNQAQLFLALPYLQSRHRNVKCPIDIVCQIDHILEKPK